MSDEPTVNTCVSTPNYTGTLRNDLKGKTNICSEVVGDVFIITGGAKDNVNLWDITFKTGTSEELEKYLNGIYPNDETEIWYYDTEMDITAEGHNPYYGKKICIAVYYKDSGDRVSPSPKCGYTLESGGSPTPIYRIPSPYNREIVFYTFIGDSIETSTEYFILPPIHKKASSY